MGCKARQWSQLANIWPVCRLGVLTTQQPTRLELFNNSYGSANQADHGIGVQPRRGSLAIVAEISHRGGSLSLARRPAKLGPQRPSLASRSADKHARANLSGS